MDAAKLPAFLAGGLLGAALAVGSLTYYREVSRWWQARSAPFPESYLQEGGLYGAGASLDSVPSTAAGISMEHALGDEILAEQFTRNVQFFGREGQLEIAKAFVIVVGLGGVGSHAAHMLLRAGVGKLRLIDFDQVSLSSLNRHAVATQADVGMPKATCLKEHFRRVVPEAEIDARVAMFTTDAEEELLSGRPNFVIDAIDDVSTKVALLAACKARGLTVISAAGAGAKADPTRMRIVDISEATVDPLARRVRHSLRTRHGIGSGIQVVLSAERPRCGLIPIKELTHEPSELQIVPNFRVRTVPVLGTMPAMFGMAAASWVLCQLAKHPYIPEPLFYVRVKEYETLLDRLRAREELVYNNLDGPEIDIDDMPFLAKDVWRGKSARAVSGETRKHKALCRSVDGLTFTRWDASQRATVDNVVMLTCAEAEAHEGTSLDALKQSDPEFVQAVEAVLQHVRKAYGLDSFVENPLYETYSGVGLT